MDNADEFLKDLQRQCLSDAGEQVTSMQDILRELESNVQASITNLLKVTHNLKGNFHAVAFSHFSGFMHRFETTLTGLLEKINAHQKPVESQDLRVLEFFISDIIGQIQSYLNELNANPTDQADHCAKRQFVFDVASAWSPTINKIDDGPVAQTQSEPPPAEISTTKNEIVNAAVAKNNEVERHTKVIEDVSGPKNLFFLLCKNGSFSFALNVSNVVEIVQYNQVNTIPYNQSDLVGLMNLRGEVVPILNLPEVSQFSKTKSLAVVCRNNSGKFGLPVDIAECVLELDTQTFQSTEESLGESDSQLINKIYLDKDRTIFIVNIDQAVAA